MKIKHALSNLKMNNQRTLQNISCWSYCCFSNILSIVCFGDSIYKLWIKPMIENVYRSNFFTLHLINQMSGKNIRKKLKKIKKFLFAVNYESKYRF